MSYTFSKVEVISGVARRRRFSTDLKLAVVAETMQPGMSISHCPSLVIMDWVSRAVLAWRLSNTLDADFCVEALEEALSRYGRRSSIPTRAASSPVPTLPAP